MTDSTDSESIVLIDWLELEDDMWRHVACFLGLHALTLRRACAAFHRRALTLEALPKATAECRKVVRFLEGLDESSIERKRLRGEKMERDLTKLPLHELFAVTDTLDDYTRLVHSKRHCRTLLTTWRMDTVLTDRAVDVSMCADETLSQEQLVGALRRFNALGKLQTARRIAFKDTDGAVRWTTTWHEAARRGLVEVLTFLHTETYQPLHQKTCSGNNALAHARQAKAERLSKDDLTEEAKKKTEASFDAVIAFLLQLGLEDKPWHGPWHPLSRGGAFEDEFESTDSDSGGSHPVVHLEDMDLDVENGAVTSELEYDWQSDSGTPEPDVWMPGPAPAPEPDAPKTFADIIGVD